MLIDDIREKVRAIRLSAGDPEGAHSQEDDLWQAVLQAIANGEVDDPRLAAFEALETTKIDFPRWCA